MLKRILKPIAAKKALCTGDYQFERKIQNLPT